MVAAVLELRARDPSGPALVPRAGVAPRAPVKPSASAVHAAARYGYGHAGQACKR